MSSLILKRSSLLSQNPSLRRHFVTYLIASLSQPHSHHLPPSNRELTVPGSGYGFLGKNNNGSSLISSETSICLSGSFSGLINSTNFRFFGSLAAVEPSTSDGLTVEGIIAHQWTILDESEGDWKSHASAIAQSIHLIKKRLQVICGYMCILVFELVLFSHFNLVEMVLCRNFIYEVLWTEDAILYNLLFQLVIQDFLSAQHFVFMPIQCKGECFCSEKSVPVP